MIAATGAKGPFLQIAWVGAAAVAVLIAVLAKPKAELASGEDAAVLAADMKLGDVRRAGDKSAARRLLSLQFTYADQAGKVYQRRQFLAGLKNLAAAPAEDVKAAIYGGVAAVTGRRKTAHDGAVFFLDIWAKQKGAWRALAMQEAVLGAPDERQDTGEAIAAETMFAELGTSYECNNPCQTIPYRVRSPAEQDVLNDFQALEKATIVCDAGQYAKYLADEFVDYGSGLSPVTKSEWVARIENMKKKNIPGFLTAVQSMRLSVYGDGAAMISTHVVPDDSEPVQRIARIWAKRNGQWQMAISVQTDIRRPPEY